MTSVIGAGTFATFTAQTTNATDTFATTALYAPTGLTASLAGHDVQLSWSAGQNGNGYAIGRVNNGTNSSCTGVTYSNVGSATGTSYTDTNHYTPEGTGTATRSRQASAPGPASRTTRPRPSRSASWRPRCSSRATPMVG